ncbi:MAG: MFS transporter [Desulfobacteraceae bacterium]|nr:MFS transporter [Desulfobacteraceae bacterium]
MNNDIEKDSYFLRNATSVSIVEFIWGLGLPILLESTFLQIFLKTLGASDFIIGLVPCIFITGISTFPLLSSYLTRNRRLKKQVVINLHILSSFATILFGISLFFVKTPSYIILLFFLSYIVFSMSIGLVLPVWLNFLVKIFSEKRSIAGFGIMMCAQSTAKLIGSFIILKMVEKFGFSTSTAAYFFLITGLLFLIGSFCFLFTKELVENEDKHINSESFSRHTKKTILEIIKNKNFLKYLVGDLDNYVVITTISFYAVYATEFFGIKASTAAGLFVSLTCAGSIAANLLFGPFDFIDFLTLKKKFISTKILSITGLFILIFMPTLTGFLIASFLFGFCRGTRSTIFSPTVKMLSNKEDTTGYFAVAPLLTMIFGSGLPVFYGLMLDMLGSMQENAYRLMFSISIFLISIIFYFAIITDFQKQTD